MARERRDRDLGVGERRHRCWGLGRIAAGGSLLVAIASCSHDTMTQPTPLSGCTSNVSISVSAGTTPTFAWTPSCTALALLVEEAGGLDQWFMWGQQEGIAPGVRYAVLPAGAIQEDPATPLEAGVRHTVALFRGTSGEDPRLWSDEEAARRLIGHISFTP